MHWLGMVAASVVLMAGCHSAKGPATYPTTGSVTLNGMPVAGAMVTFAAAGQGGAGVEAIASGMAGAQAQTDAEGRFEMKVMLDGGKTTKPGLPAGEYAVTVVKMEFAGGTPSPTSPPKNTLPAKYASAQSSTLKATVKAEGENRFDFPL